MFRSVILEAAVVGVVASAIGLVVGLFLARWINRGLDEIGAELPTSSLVVRPTTFVLSFVMGLVATFLAALLPAVRATRVPPLAALRDVSADRAPSSTRRLVAGLGLLAAGALGCSAAWREDGASSAIPVVGLGAVLVIVGVIVVGPALAGRIVGLPAYGLYRLKGVTGRLAGENAARNPRRTSATASAVLISVALVVFVTAFATSAIRSVESDARRGFVGDFIVTGGGGLTLPNGLLTSPIPPSVREEVAKVDGVELVVGMGYSTGRLVYPDGDSAAVFVSSVDEEGLGTVLHPRMREGDAADLDDDGVIVDRLLANDHDLELGDTITYSVEDGPSVELVLQGVSDDPNLLGYATVTRDTYARVAPEVRDVQVAGRFEGGADPVLTLLDIQSALSRTPNVWVLDRESFIADLKTQITSFVNVIYGLLVLSVLISVLGIANTLSLTIHERTRELGLLRAVGMDRAGVRSSVRWEAAVIGLFGMVVGLVVGAAVSAAVVVSLRELGLVTFALPAGGIVLIATGAVAFAAVAAVRPARARRPGVDPRRDRSGLMRGRGRTWRAGVVAAVSAVIVLAGLAPAAAQDEAPPEPEAATTTGSAGARAIVTQVTPGVGSFPTGLAAGVALSNVTNSIAQAQAESLDLGLIGILIESFDLVNGFDVPDALFRDNRSGDASASHEEYPIAGSTLGGGRTTVRTTKAVPSATATSTVLGAYSNGLVSIEGGRAESTSEVLPGEGRQARASVTLDLEIAGLVKLSGLRWDAVHRTGTGAHSDATFGLSAASIGGVPIRLDSLADSERAINAALVSLGLSIQLPKVERIAEPVELVRVTSLRIMFRDSEVGKTLFGPVLDASRTQREQLFRDLTGADDLTIGPLLAAEVTTAILSGSGFFAVEVGGAEASSSPIVIPDVTPGTAGAPLAGPTLSPPVPLPATGTPAASRVVVRGPAVGPLEDRCESAHLLRPLGCSAGLLLPVGLVGVGGAVLVGAVDLRRHRRAVEAVAGVSLLSRRTVFAHPLRAYAPVLAVGLAMAVVAVAVTVPRDHVAFESPLSIPDPDGAAAGDGAVAEGLVPGISGPGGPVSGSGSGTVDACRERALQVPQDPYSPPCYVFSGDNGGATTVGVTRDEITVSIRAVEGGSATDIFSALGGQDIQEPTQTGNETAVALAEYFSKNFQFYGRNLKLEFFDGEGNGLEELLSGGKEKALADATRAAQELHAFADLGAITIPYADALAQQKVVNIGSPYPSQQWYEARRPYSWSVFSDGTNLVSATSSAMIGRFPPGSRAEHAGPELRDKPRRFAVVAPENAEYQESMEVLIARLRAAGIEVVTNQKYKLDLFSFPNQASNIIAQIKDAGVTSVVCICDPAMLAYGLTLKANEQSYEPEWITAGIVFVEQDVIAQLIDTKQWSHAFGTAYNAYSEPFGASFPYYAYKSVRPADEPVRGVEELYYMMYMLAIGIQMAGPNLTPESFEAGMFAYPDRFGPRGTWDFGPGDYTPTNDYREIWWDPNRTSGQNQRKGAWAELNEGQRYTPENPPRGRAAFFEEG